MNIVAMHHNPTLNNSNTPVILASMSSITERRRISAHLKLVSLILISHLTRKTNPAWVSHQSLVLLWNRHMKYYLRRAMTHELPLSVPLSIRGTAGTSPWSRYWRTPCIHRQLPTLLKNNVLKFKLLIDLIHSVHIVRRTRTRQENLDRSNHSLVHSPLLLPFVFLLVPWSKWAPKVGV